MEKNNSWIWWIAAGAVVLWWLSRRGGLGLSAVPDAYYIPPAGGTAQPGTAPAPSPALAIVRPSNIPPAVPTGATAGPSVASVSGRGHF